MITQQMLEDVRTFMITFGQPTEYDVIPEEVKELRRNLIREEYRELVAAALDNNKVEVADALTDIVYVTLGAKIVMGDESLPVFSEIGSTVINLGYMTLESDPLLHLDEILEDVVSLAKLWDIPLEKCFNEVHSSNMSKLGVDGKPIYREDGKVLKGPNFFNPNLKAILDEHYKG